MLKTKSQRKEVLAALVELFNPFRTLNTHMHSKASLMVNKHHSEPSLVFLPGHRKAFALRALETKQSMPTRVNKFETFYQVMQNIMHLHVKTFKPASIGRGLTAHTMFLHFCIKLSHDIWRHSLQKCKKH